MTQDHPRLIAVGDVHGCVHAVDALIRAIRPTEADTLVFLGDLIDQGRESSEVLDYLINLQHRCRVVLITGNHEEMMFAARDNVEALRYWEDCGGVYTLNSYRFGADLGVVPEKHWNLLKSAVPFYETDEFIFTHANYASELAMNEQPPHQLRWAIFEPDDMQPHRSGKTVIVGHTEQRNCEILDIGFAICIDTACWRHGWLTALDVESRDFWQASRWGVLREDQEPTHRGKLPQFVRRC